METIDIVLEYCYLHYGSVGLEDSVIPALYACTVVRRCSAATG